MDVLNTFNNTTAITCVYVSIIIIAVRSFERYNQ